MPETVKHCDLMEKAAESSKKSSRKVYYGFALVIILAVGLAVALGFQSASVQDPLLYNMP
ncbi:MAG: hypothetical protein QXV09_00145 [Candidatus Bathyarchaeia archaeon]